VDAAKVAATQVQGLADDLLETSKQNRELLTGLVRTEVDRAAGRLGFVREEELAAVRRHVSRLEGQLADIRTQIGGGAVVAAAPSAKPVKKKVPVKPAPVAPDTSDSDSDSDSDKPGPDAGATAPAGGSGADA
jgi:hypothetical protein